MSTPNYDRPSFSGSLWKEPRGSKVLAKEDKKADDDKVLALATKDAKARDLNRCRFPVKHKCRGGLEAAHVKDKSTSGRAGSVPQNLITVCRWLHRSGPLSIHGGDYEIVPLTDKGTNGPVAVYRRIWLEGRSGESELNLIRKERAIHQWEKA